VPIAVLRAERKRTERRESSLGPFRLVSRRLFVVSEEIRDQNLL